MTVTMHNKTGIGVSDPGVLVAPLTWYAMTSLLGKPLKVLSAPVLGGFAGTVGPYDPPRRRGSRHFPRYLWCQQRCPARKVKVAKVNLPPSPWLTMRYLWP